MDSLKSPEQQSDKSNVHPNPLEKHQTSSGVLELKSVLDQNSVESRLLHYTKTIFEKAKSGDDPSSIHDDAQKRLNDAAKALKDVQSPLKESLGGFLRNVSDFLTQAFSDKLSKNQMREMAQPLLKICATLIAMSSLDLGAAYPMNSAEAYPVRRQLNGGAGNDVPTYGTTNVTSTGDTGSPYTGVLLIPEGIGGIIVLSFVIVCCKFSGCLDGGARKLNNYSNSDTSLSSNEQFSPDQTTQPTVVPEIKDWQRNKPQPPTPLDKTN